MRVLGKREQGLDKESDSLCSGILVIGAISRGNAHDPPSHLVCKCFSSTLCFSQASFPLLKHRESFGTHQS